MRFLIALSLLSSLLLGGCRGRVESASPGLATASTPPSSPVPTMSVKDAEQLVAQKEQELQIAKGALKEAVVHSRQVKCRWLIGILALLSAASAAGAWYLPIFRWKMAGAAAICAGLIPVVLFVSRLAPYWEHLGAGVLVLALITALVLWYREHKTLGQVVSAVEDVKTTAPHLWSSMKGAFKNRIDETVRPLIAGLIPKAPAP